MDNLNRHYKTKDYSDRIALSFTKFLRFLADTFFKKRYGHRAVVLETVAAVPGMVGGMLLHLKSLRKMEDDKGWIKILLDEAANERMHLMTFIEIAKPTFLERSIIMLAQFIFIIMYTFIYVVSQKTAHRIVGYFEEEAVISYTDYLEQIDSGKAENIPAPTVAINYYGLKKDAKLRDVVIAVREDERGHAKVNHNMADILKRAKNVSNT